LTIGENIQEYRKKLGLSQEELGQKLFVSRQTISLWEKDQTLPTIENLKRLKEIFNISVDKILGYNETKKEICKATEFYKFNFNENEVKEIYRLNIKNIYKRRILSVLILLFVIVFYIGTSAPDFAIGIFFGLTVLTFISGIKSITRYKKIWKKSAPRICESTYEYEVFEDYFKIRIYRNDETVRESKHKFTDIENVRISGKWFFMQISGQLYILKTNALKRESKFFISTDDKKLKIPTEIKSGKIKIFSIILFAVTILSLFIGFFIVANVSGENSFVPSEYMWILFLFTPVPISSIIFGYVMQAKGYRTKKNIIGGIIMLIILCVYGSFTFIFSDTYSHTDEPIKRAEQMIEINIPEHKQINTTDLVGTVHYYSEIFFDKDKTESFENELSENKKFLKSMPSKLVGILSPFISVENYDYILIYNIDTKEYNVLPDKDGEYRYLTLVYNVEKDLMRITEYQVDYIK